MKLFKFLILFISVLMLFGCEIYTNSIESKSKEFLQESFTKDDKFSKYQLKVKEITLVSESLSKFNGIAKVEMDEKIYDVPVEVTADLSHTLVETKPGALNFLVAKEINEAKAKFEKEMETTSKDLDKKMKI